MDRSIQEFALKSDQLHQINSIFQNLVISIPPQESMVIAYFENIKDEEARQPFDDNNEEEKLNQSKLGPSAQICIDPLCMEQTRFITEDVTHQNHQHKVITQRKLLQDLKVLKHNQNLKNFNKQKADQILKSLNKVQLEMQKFEREITTILRKLKTKTLKHLTEVRQSFEDKHYEAVKKKVLQNFDYPTVSYALGEIQKFQMLRYDNLQYPFFKANILQSRFNENIKQNKDACLSKLKAWSDHLLGDHYNYKKVFNRSIQTIMFKSISEKRIFSYFLKSHNYQVTKLGKKIKRVAMSQKLPVAVIEKKLCSDKTLIKVNKIGKKGVVVGCGILKQMQKNHFNNCYSSGFFLHSDGIVFTQNQRVQTKNIFKYTQGDVISVHKDDYRIYFHKVQGKNREVDGFYVNLKPFEEEGTLNGKENFYAAVFLGDKQAELQIFS